MLKVLGALLLLAFLAWILIPDPPAGFERWEIALGLLIIALVAGVFRRRR